MWLIIKSYITKWHNICLYMPNSAPGFSGRSALFSLLSSSTKFFHSSVLFASKIWVSSLHIDFDFFLFCFVCFLLKFCFKKLRQQIFSFKAISINKAVFELQNKSTQINLQVVSKPKISLPKDSSWNNYREGEHGQNVTWWPFAALSGLILHSLGPVLPLSMDWTKKSLKAGRALWPMYLSILQDI